MQLLKRMAREVLKRTPIPVRARTALFVFHDISRANSPQHSELYSTTPEQFVRQLAFIESHFRVVRLDQAIAWTGDSPAAAITFDDGFASVLHTAAPLLARLGLPFAVFITVDAVVKDFCLNGVLPRRGARTFLDCDDVRELYRSGVQIGAHGTTHANLAACPDFRVNDEIATSLQFVAELTGIPSTHFAIPFGKREHFDSRVLACCETHGVEHVYSSNPMFDVPGNSTGRPVIHPRFGLTSDLKNDIRFLLNRAMLRDPAL